MNFKNFVALEKFKRKLELHPIAYNSYLTNKNFAIEAVKVNGINLRVCNIFHKDDLEVVMLAVSNNGMALEFVSDRLRANAEVAICAMKTNAFSIEYVSPELIDDDSFLMRIVVELADENNSGFGFERLFSNIEARGKGSKELLMRVQLKNWEFMRNMPDKYTKDRDIILRALSFDGSLLRNLPQLQDDREAVLLAVKNDGSALEVVSKNLRRDPEVVRLAIKNCPIVIVYAHKSLRTKESLRNSLKDGEGYVRADLKKPQHFNFIFTKSDAKILLRDEDNVIPLLQECGELLKYADKKVRDNYDAVFGAVSKDGCALEFASARLKNDKSLVIIAIANHPNAWSYIGDSLRADKELAMLAVSGSGYIYRNIKNYEECMGLINDIDIICTAVHTTRGVYEENGLLVGGVSKNPLVFRSTVLGSKTIPMFRHLRNLCVNDQKTLNADYEFISSAIFTCPKNLEYVSPKMRLDCDIVSLAVSTDGMTLKYANSKFKRDAKIVLISAISNIGSLMFANKAMMPRFYSVLDVLVCLRLMISV